MCEPAIHIDTASEDYDGGLTVVCAGGRCRRSRCLWSLRRARRLRRCRRSSGALTTSSLCAGRRCAALDGLAGDVCGVACLLLTEAQHVCHVLVQHAYSYRYSCCVAFVDPSAVQTTAYVSGSAQYAHVCITRSMHMLLNVLCIILKSMLITTCPGAAARGGGQPGARAEAAPHLRVQPPHAPAAAWRAAVCRCVAKQVWQTCMRACRSPIRGRNRASTRPCVLHATHSLHL